ncbi:UDP-N-acetylmuramate--L-alanine ligase [Desulfobaculum bizertense]|uniref:UDP-N-acetylmuramate--L-alanine ligase n=1 Tax=Desulfobaculum bizertense DSM 18034 TaxID=1121442 RepID=A0A1T4VXD1_9BACT|nr:UDP-N-acetylmuramate--L-alanine ligase [Desulfobaculum bizertense]UIJ36922.1 UDP-N-acetylmuramate--L-alanine ligase [Desulfobaculum bizertense]SKA69662.1 UDP-N-acetylmuramate--L-alanine ligase [Desulfobaculum bizertense DSM 18034]
MKNKIRKIHMVGIGGTGMNGIAEVLLSLGYEVSGSDLSSSPVTERLQSLGATVFQGHAAGHVGDADVLVKSTAVREDNPEVMEAREHRIPVIPRAEMLAELMRLRQGIAVAGTHGKTTTTSLLATIFTEAKLDPTVIIGGRLNAFGTNALLGKGEFLIAEADESDGSFLCLSPIMTVVTNVDLDHLDFYDDMDQIRETFINFMNRVPFYGRNVVCGDNPVVRSILPEVKRPVMTYGLSEGNRLRGKIKRCEDESCFDVFYRDEYWGEVILRQPGLHNVLNALAAIGVSIEAGVPQDAILRGLATFGGVGRRFERKGERDGVLVVDDYGHHPTEIKATLATARQCYPDRRLVVAFQPHRYTRTKALFQEFCSALGQVDSLLLTEIYPASEKPIPGVTGECLAQGIRNTSQADVKFYDSIPSLTEALPQVLHSGDVLLTLGAGNIWQAGTSWLGSEG